MKIQAQLLQSHFDALKAATITEGSDGHLVSIAKKRVDCVTDTFGGTRCG